MLFFQHHSNRPPLQSIKLQAVQFASRINPITNSTSGKLGSALSKPLCCNSPIEGGSVQKNSISIVDNGFAGCAASLTENIRISPSIQRLLYSSFVPTQCFSERPSRLSEPGLVSSSNCKVCFFFSSGIVISFVYGFVRHFPNSHLQNLESIRAV